jgi:hypothetical protein
MARVLATARSKVAMVADLSRTVGLALATGRAAGYYPWLLTWWAPTHRHHATFCAAGARRAVQMLLAVAYRSQQHGAPIGTATTSNTTVGTLPWQALPLELWHSILTRVRTDELGGEAQGL